MAAGSSRLTSAFDHANRACLAASLTAAVSTATGSMVVVGAIVVVVLVGGGRRCFAGAVAATDQQRHDQSSSEDRVCGHQVVTPVRAYAPSRSALAVAVLETVRPLISGNHGLTDADTTTVTRLPDTDTDCNAPPAWATKLPAAAAAVA